MIRKNGTREMIVRLLARSRYLAGFVIICSIVTTDLPAQERRLGELRKIKAMAVKGKINIDGNLDDEVWQQADWQSDFIQLKPFHGKLARVQTRVAVAFDDTYIYAAFRCFNPTGSSANSRINRRDGNMDMDNAVTLYLDSFHTRRDCYFFSTNSLGTQLDGRIGEDGHSNDKNWDCTWYVKSREDSLGWTAEMAIPVNEIRLPVKNNTLSLSSSLYLWKCNG